MKIGNLCACLIYGKNIKTGIKKACRGGRLFGEECAVIIFII
jgi:hypothetical protein